MKVIKTVAEEHFSSEMLLLPCILLIDDYHEVAIAMPSLNRTLNKPLRKLEISKPSHSVMNKHKRKGESNTGIQFTPETRLSKKNLNLSNPSCRSMDCAVKYIKLSDLSVLQQVFSSVSKGLSSNGEKTIELRCVSFTVTYSGRLEDRYTDLDSQTLAFKNQFSSVIFFQLYFNKKYIEMAINDFTMLLIISKWLRMQKCRQMRKRRRQRGRSERRNCQVNDFNSFYYVIHASTRFFFFVSSLHFFLLFFLYYLLHLFKLRSLSSSHKLTAIQFFI